ncbi:hypothetical protein [Sphingomonas soli]|uniref:hypothetical protein n=1 Tax=Sphingomonas soli TaxID=266127 RepID=UPI000832D042|nr:hypothetical protein [Sphingomonas soli]
MASDPARTRRRLMAALALGLLLLLPCAILLQTGTGPQAPLLAGVVAGAATAMSASLGMTGLQLRALGRPALDEVLNDELSTRNSVRAMAVGYVAAVSVAGIALPLAVWLGLPAVPLLTGVVLAGVVAHAGSFAWFERQGDDGDG